MGKKSGSSPPAPAPVDPAALAREQAEANRITQFLPTGNLIFGETTEDPDAPSGLGFEPSAEHAALRLDESANQQAIREIRENLSTTMGVHAQGLASQLPKEPFGIENLPTLLSQLNTENLPELLRALDLADLPGLAGGINQGELGTRGPGGIDLSRLKQFEGVGAPPGAGPLPPGAGPLPGGGGFDEGASAFGFPGKGDGAGGDPRSRIEDATFQRQMRLFQPQFDVQTRRHEQQMANLGLPSGSELNTIRTRELRDAQNEAMLRAGMDSVIAGGQEQSRLFGLSAAQRGQQFGEQATNLELARQLRATDIGEQVTGQNLASVAQAAGINQQITSSQLAQASRGQDIAEQMQNAGLSQTARQLGLQEMLTTRQLPFNELAVLLGLDQTAPTSLASFVPPGAVDVVGPASLAAQQAALAQQAAQSGQNTMMSGLFGLGGALGGAAIMGCWVAQECFGIMNPRWLLFRDWLEHDAPKWFNRLYIKHGKRFAAWVSDKPLLKRLIRRWMEGRIKRSRAAGARMLKWRTA